MLPAVDNVTFAEPPGWMSGVAKRPLSALASWSFQYRIDPGSPVSLTPYANIRVNSPDFVQRGAGVDAIVGQSDAEQPLQFTAATPFSNGRKPVLQFERFVHMTGGGYFFAPSVTTIRTQLARQPGGGHE